jgi:hypothetical protein
MSMMSSIQINCYTNKPNSVNGKFAPIEMVVYKIPTINECIKLLPRDIGNHILSFTNAWLEWYLENIRYKYGDKFILDMLVNMLKTKHQLTFRRVKLREIVGFIILKMGTKITYWCNKLTRDDVRFAFEDHLVKHLTTIVSKQQLKINKQQEYDLWFSILQVGDILEINTYYDNIFSLVVSKTDKSFKYINVKIMGYNPNFWKIYEDQYHNIRNVRIGRKEYPMKERRPIRIFGDIELDLENPMSQINEYYPIEN